jgi:alpha-amylase/alpha-mannosidase (GH57 family)
MDRYICIHAHFYQPPRENPWLEDIEVQDSAYPFHDWNDRITAECYAPNTASRILDSEGRIVDLPNNYAKISFNFGPTLLSWLQLKVAETYEAILAADRMSQKNFSGHGSALAQAYNHMIMPLAAPRDKYTQVFWGIRDFESRFGRPPEGLWLPETAVDLETLDIMALMGIRFTILSPHQAKQVRPLGHEGWLEVSGGRIDPTMAYALILPSDFHQLNRQRQATSPHTMNASLPRLLWGFKLSIPGVAQDRGSRGAGFLPGDGVVGLQPGGPRQPAAGGFRRQDANPQRA